MLQIGLEEFALDFFFPFILLFSVFYILLHQLRIFGDPSSSLVRKVNLVIALSTATLIVLINPLGISFSSFISQLFSSTAIIILALVLLIFFSALISLTGVEKIQSWLPPAIALGLVILLFSSTEIWKHFQFQVRLTKVEIDFGVIAVIILILIIFGIIKWLMKGERPQIQQ